MMSDPTEPRGWWVISGDSFAEALRRAHAGEEPEMLYAEFYANSEVERPADCPTCTWPRRETSGLVCQTCGWDYNNGEKP